MTSRTTTTSSHSARERADPPPRRKSCAACIKAKRRCDLALPTCLRCTQRSISCDYPLAQGGRRRRDRTTRPDGPTAASVVPPIEDVSTTWLAADDDGSHDFPAGLETWSSLQLEDWPLALGLDTVQQLTVAAPTTHDMHVAEVIARRLQFAMDEIKAAPSLMILETQTPWCHPLLYSDDMPASMQDAHASCALYLARNRTNAPVIFRAITARANSLLATPPPTTLPLVLAHTQALLLYQMIRLFDGDMLARTSAESIIPKLEEAAMCLLSYVRFDLAPSAGSSPSTEDHLPLSLYPLASTKAFWKDWILHESARRTVLFAFFFLQAWRLVTGQQGLLCDGRLGLCHSWTASRHLWTAGSAVQFAQAWKNKRHFVVTDAAFDEMLTEAAADDVDRFGRMWITTLLGVEEAEGWFASRGGDLRAF